MITNCSSDSVRLVSYQKHQNSSRDCLFWAVPTKITVRKGSWELIPSSPNEDIAKNFSCTKVL